MNETHFKLPQQCRNCKRLKELIEDYVIKVDELNNHALQTGIEIERLELTVGASQHDRDNAAAQTEQKLRAVTFISEAMAARLQDTFQITELYCRGTTEPTNPEPQRCTIIESVLE